MSNNELLLPEEFSKIIKDFINDIKSTFPEYGVFINRWWKPNSYFDNIQNIVERDIAIKQSETNSLEFIFKFCKKKFPPRFFDILYKNEDLFKDDSTLDTEFLPYIHFKNLWECDITEKTRNTIWKYLQLILFSIIGSLTKRDDFGDTSKIFDTINEDEFKEKLEETFNQMHSFFDNNSEDNNSQSNINMNNIPKATEIHNHITDILDTKLGNLAKEIAEETANEMNLDMDNITDMKGVFDNLFKNPKKLMDLAKNIGDKLDNKLKSGDLKESELMSEASDMLSQMKNMPGMENFQSMLNQFGLSGLGGSKLNLNAIENQLNKNIKSEQKKEYVNKKNANISNKQLVTHRQPIQNNIDQILTDDQLDEIFKSETNNDHLKRNKKHKNK
jgi:hypothetical protein